MTAGGKTSKKRAAFPQVGPKSKRLRSEKPPIRDDKPSVVRRGRPVTLPQTHGSDTSSDEEVENSSKGDAESTDEDTEMPDVPTKDPNGGQRIQASEINARLTDRTVQLQGKRIRHRKFSLTNARLQNLMLLYSETLRVYGALPCRKILARSGRNTSPILWTFSVVMSKTSSSNTMPAGSSRL